MGFLLQWASYSVRSKGRILSDLFSYLSPRWYPTRIIGSNIYNIFEMYADQLSSASVETGQIFDDLSVSTVRTTPIDGRSTIKAYDNFGAIFEVNKLWGQNAEAYSTGSLLMGYRQQLKFLADAYLEGSAITALTKAGQSFTGVSPIVLEPFNDDISWRTTSFSASVVSAGKDVIVLDTYYPGVGDIIYTNKITNPLGKTIYYSHSRLGYNTNALSKSHFYSGLKVFIYGSASVNPTPYVTPGNIDASLKSSIENVVNNLVRADIKPIFFYSDNFVYDRYFYGDTILGDSAKFDINENGYVTNNKSYGNYNQYVQNLGVLPSEYINSPSGAILRSHVVELPSDYLSYDWFYDYAVLLKNDAFFIPKIRSYSNSNIPDTVYFKEIKNVAQNTLMLSSSGSVGAHWVFHNIAQIRDIKGAGNNLPIDTTNPSYLLNVEIMRPRTGLRLGIYGKNGPFLYKGSTSSELNFYNTDFSIEAWIYGIDSDAESSMSYFAVKRQLTDENSEILTSAGYSFVLDATDKRLKLSIHDGSSSETITASISSLFDELPRRPHYFAASYNSGLCFLYLDGKQIGSGSFTITPANVSSGYTYVRSEGTNIGVDEILLKKSGLLPNQALQRFNDSKPYQDKRLINELDLERYHQLELEVHASGSMEFEYHQFSVRGINPTYLHKPSIYTITGTEYDLNSFTARPLLYVTPIKSFDLNGFTAKPLLYLQDAPNVRVNNFYSNVSIESNEYLLQFTARPVFAISGTTIRTQNINNFYSDVEISLTSTTITTEDGDTLIAEDGSSLITE